MQFQAKSAEERLRSKPEYFTGRRLLSRTLPVGDWQTNLARVCLAVDAGCRFTRGRLDGNVAPCCRSIARDAVVGQAKNRSPVHLLARFRTRPHEMFRLEFLILATMLHMGVAARALSASARRATWPGGGWMERNA